MSETAMLNIVLRECGELFRPLEMLETGEGVALMLRSLGYDFPAATFPAAVSSIKTTVHSLRQDIQSMEAAVDPSDKAARCGAIAEDVLTLIVSFKDLGANWKSSLTTYLDFRDHSGIETTFFIRLLNYLLTRYLAENHRQLYSIFSLLGLIQWVHVDASPATFQCENLQANIYWDRFLLLFGRPREWANQVYGWETDFDDVKFLSRLFFVLNEFDVVGGRRPQSPGISSWLGRPAGANEEYVVPIFSEEQLNASIELGVAFSGAPESGNKKAGFAIFPYASGSFSEELDLERGWALKVGGSMEAGGPIGIVLRPPADLEVKFNFLSASAIPDGSFSLALVKRSADADPMVLFGKLNGTRLTLKGFSGGTKVSKSGSEFDFAVEVELQESMFVFDAKDGDGFLQKVLPDGLSATFDLGVAYSIRHGFYLKSGSLEVGIPLHISIGGVVNLDVIHIGFKPNDGNVEIKAALTGSLKIGPISASVEQVGIKFILMPTQDGTGNLGSLNLGTVFHPPKGLGLAVNASVVIGGGYLFFDPDNAKYAGVLQLEIAKKISISAIGLLTTRMPDGSDGFSLLIIICAEFPPIQLGFGFVLKGLGGLVGINRTMVLAALRAGVKNRTLNSILFPKDPIANAPKIISDLSTIYPPANGRFVFGPMIMLGWGSPEPLLKIELGLVLEIPSPVRIAILGRISLALPDEKAALVVVHLDIIGAVDFDTCDASVDATLYDSRVVMFVITGDMAMRVNWGPRSVFIASLGGFHPNFQTPPNFPTLERLAIILATGDNPRLRLESYMAVTSNTVQFGAHLDIYAAVHVCIIGTFSAQANMSLDAFLNLSPFWFQVDISASAAIYHNDDVLIGVHLALSLAGPEPWHAWGDATFDFFGKHSISFDVTIAGDQPAPPPLPPADPLPELLEALGDARNWSAQLPEDGNMLVTLRSLPPGDGVLAHPFGVLTVRQKVMPLGVAIQKFGAANVDRPTAYSVADIQLGTLHVYAPDEVKDAFAPGQFFNLSADEKLSRPAFEAFTAGHTGFGSSNIYYPAAKAKTAVFNYENVVIDIKDKDKPHPKTSTRAASGKPAYALHPAVIEALIARGAAARSPLQARGSERFRGPKQTLGINEPSYMWVNKQTLKPTGTADATTYTEARQARPNGANDAQLVGSHEVKP